MNRFVTPYNTHTTPPLPNLAFLQHSPCIHDKVIQKNDYKTKCVDNYLATLDKTGSLSNIDDRLDTTCCAYNRWEECSYA